ncbi:Hypothetical protein POVR1_LOCUS425 [uncultured virus]|nr:Hypothetical protein POVR1_LOCUS425 [uncultured virus]
MNLWDDIWKNIFLVNLDEKKQGHATLYNLHDASVFGNRIDTMTYDVNYLETSLYKYEPTQLEKFKSMTPKKIKKFYHDISSSVVINLLKIGNGKMSLCGGSVLSCLREQSLRGNCFDFDFFFHCSQTDADEILEKCLWYLGDEGCKRFQRNQGVVTCQLRNNMLQINQNYQFIKRLYKTKDQVLLGFDLAGCQYGYNLVDGIYMTLSGMFALITNAVPVDLSQCTKSYCHRLRKYHDTKGFTILFPGLIREIGSDRRVTSDIFPIKKIWSIQSDYDLYGSSLKTLLSTPSLFSFSFSSARDCLDLPEKSVRKSAQKTISRLARPPIGTIDARSITMIGEANYKTFKQYHVMDENEEVSKQMWNDARKIHVETAYEFSRRLNDNLKWKTENPGCQHFGKLHPIKLTAKEFYKGTSKAILIGIDNDRYKTFVMICHRMVAGMTDDIVKLLMNEWLRMEAEEVLVRLMEMRHL